MEGWRLTGGDLWLHWKSVWWMLSWGALWHRRSRGVTHGTRWSRGRYGRSRGPSTLCVLWAATKLISAFTLILWEVGSTGKIKCTIRLRISSKHSLEFDYRLFWLPQSNFLCQVHSWLNFDFKQGGDLLPRLARSTICRTALTRSGQQPHPRRRLWKWGDTLLSQILQFQLVLSGILLFSVNYLINVSESRNRPMLIIRVKCLLAWRCWD